MTLFFSHYGWWFIIGGIPLILILDLISHLMGYPTISEDYWSLKDSSNKKIAVISIYTLGFIMGFLACHFLLGSSGNG